MSPRLPQAPCVCRSGKAYGACCRPLHKGLAAPDPERLMRSRFSAYALGLVDYILATTHPGGPRWQPEETDWRADVLRFSRGTKFLGLQILAAGAEGDVGHVTFRAILDQGGHDASFVERSRFVRDGGAWRYWGAEG